MAAAAQIVEGMGADIVDVNMGCPVPKIAKHNAGCSLMREPAHAASVIGAMAKAVKIPVTVKMRAGWNDASRNAPELAQRGAGRRRRGGDHSRPHRGAVVQRLRRLGSRGATSPSALDIPVFGSGDCVEPEQIVERHARRASAACSSAAACCATRGSWRRPPTWPPAARRAHGHAARSAGSSCSTTSSCCSTSACDEARRVPARRAGQSDALGARAGAWARALGHQQGARALRWYSKGLDGGSQLRVARQHRREPRRAAGPRCRILSRNASNRRPPRHSPHDSRE